MYVLIISRGYPSEKYKMNGIFEFDQAKALVQAGHKVIYAAIDVRSFRRKRKWGFESIVKDGVQIQAINVPCGRIPKAILSRVRIFALRKLYKSIVSKYGIPDIIHAHFLDYGFITARLFEKDRTPLVLTEHFSGMNEKELNPYLKELGYYTYSRMDKVITVSRYLANGIKEKFDVEAKVIPNIIDTTNFVYKNGASQDKLFCFVSTCRLVENKRMDLLIEAFNKTFKGNDRVRLYIYGDGPERSNLEKMIQEYELTDNILLMGLVGRNEISKKMSESECFVLPSRLETFGVAYIEALAMGLPVIATKCGGPEDFVTEENGIWVPIDDIDALAEALEIMYRNGNNYNRQKISESIISKFGSEVIANQLVEVYHNLLNKKEKE